MQFSGGSLERRPSRAHASYKTKRYAHQADFSSVAARSYNGDRTRCHVLPSLRTKLAKESPLPKWRMLAIWLSCVVSAQSIANLMTTFCTVPNRRNLVSISILRNRTCRELTKKRATSDRLSLPFCSVTRAHRPDGAQCSCGYGHSEMATQIVLREVLRFRIDWCLNSPTFDMLSCFTSNNFIVSSSDERFGAAAGRARRMFWNISALVNVWTAATSDSPALLCRASKSEPFPRWPTSALSASSRASLSDFAPAPYASVLPSLLPSSPFITTHNGSRSLCRHRRGQPRPLRRHPCGAFFFISSVVGGQGASVGKIALEDSLAICVLRRPCAACFLAGLPDT